MEALEERLSRIEAMLAQLVERQQVRQWYSVDEFYPVCREEIDKRPRIEEL
jgi:hypothetical protein